jgi:4-amino-4-deoxy-L-arabinose transferase-like glycosyltransferase
MAKVIVGRQTLYRLALFLLCALCAFVVIYFLFFHRVADRDLWSSHEARAAMDAKSILDEGAWGLPHLYDGRLELQKPPLYYWLVAGIARWRGGVDAWAVRLPATLSALGCVIGVFLFAWRCGRPVAGLIAAIMLTTAVHFTWLARVGRIDMPLTLAVSVFLFGIYSLLDPIAKNSRTVTGPERKRRAGFTLGRRLRQAHVIGVYLSLAAGLLLKGPIALVLPTAALVLFLLIERQLPTPWQFRGIGDLAQRLGLWWGLPLGVGVAAGWFIWADAVTGHDLFRTFFWHHNFERASGENVVDRWAHPWWLYGPLFVANFLPWSLALPVAAWLIWRQGWWREDRMARFGAVWFASMLAVLSCVSFKRADYMLPAYPGAALLLGCVGESVYRTVVNRRRWAASFVLVALICVAGWVVYLHVFLPEKDRKLECREFAAEVRRWAPAPARVSFFRMEAHALAFHVGRPLDIFVEWDRLAAQITQAGPRYVVMPLARFAECGKHVPVERFETLLTSAHAKPLVLLRTRPSTTVARADESANAGTAATAADCYAANHRAAAGPERSAGP